jgi:hypothetical protein
MLRPHRGPIRRDVQRAPDLFDPAGELSEQAEPAAARGQQPDRLGPTLGTGAERDIRVRSSESRHSLGPGFREQEKAGPRTFGPRRISE